MKCYVDGFQDIAEKHSFSQFQVHLVDENGDLCLGEHKVLAHLTSQVYGDTVTASVSSTEKPGVYEVSYSPTKFGPHEILVTVNGVPLKDAPFTVFVRNPQVSCMCDMLLYSTH